MNTICPFMSTAADEVICKENCTMYIAGQGKNCLFSRLPIYYNQTRESLTVLSNKLESLLSLSKEKV
ncbi:MAG TPA: hypothetical protein VFF47_01495 [Nitrospirota bacterium]|nr:hypothetical protein [Nitrospirota bacterium]